MTYMRMRMRMRMGFGLGLDCRRFWESFWRDFGFVIVYTFDDTLSAEDWFNEATFEKQRGQE